MPSLSATATVVRPGLARGKTSAPKAQAHKSCAMSGLTGSAPAFLGKPSALSAGIVTAGGARGAGSRSVATMGLFGLGLPELVVIGGVAAVLFGPSKLPELGKSLGKTVKSFQAAANVRARPRPRASDFRDPHVPARASFPSSRARDAFRFSSFERTIVVLTRDSRPERAGVPRRAQGRQGSRGGRGAQADRGRRVQESRVSDDERRSRASRFARDCRSAVRRRRRNRTGE